MAGQTHPLVSARVALTGGEASVDNLWPGPLSLTSTAIALSLNATVGATRDDRSAVSHAIGTDHAHARGGDPPEAEIHLTARQDDVLCLVPEGLSDNPIVGSLRVRP